MDQHLPVTVFLDGSAVKRIREEKKLTQLYVSKVVGVTTDTISRWENNRYPTVKRDNLLGLAEALEVDVREIVIDDPDATRSDPSTRTLKRWPYILSALVLIACGYAAYLFWTSDGPATSFDLRISRTLPNFVAPGSKVPVRVSLESPVPSGGFILREYFPKGWKLIQSSPPASSLDNVNGVVRLINKEGDSRQRIAYMLQADPAAKYEATGLFHGEVIVSGSKGQASFPVEGKSSVAIAPVLWADSNGDFVIDDAEMLEASYTVDEMQGVHIEWVQLEKLWDAGRYRWDENKRDFLPVR